MFFEAPEKAHISRVGQNHRHTYIYLVYGVIGRKITIHMVIYGVYIRFWPTLHIFHYVHVSPQDATMVAAQVQLLALIEVDHRATKHTHTH